VHRHDAPRSSSLSAASARRDGRHDLGVLGEELAAAHLSRLGFTIVARNVRTRHGEIDLIAWNGSVLAFIEVKTRRASARGRDSHPDPLEGLRSRQRARLRRLAVAWLAEGAARRPAARTIRFDAIGVTVDGHGRLLRLDHLAGAW
jgi:putative endonuclease